MANESISCRTRLMTKRILYSSFLLFIIYNFLLTEVIAQQQADTLPKFSLKNVGGNRIVIGWANQFETVRQIINRMEDDRSVAIGEVEQNHPGEAEATPTTSSTKKRKTQPSDSVAANMQGNLFGGEM